MMGNSVKSLRGADLRVSTEQRPDWILATERTPTIGETVYCSGGEGTLVALHGKTGDGSRLLQIRLPFEKSPPFFAAASNVLVRPVPYLEVLIGEEREKDGRPA